MRIDRTSWTKTLSVPNRMTFIVLFIALGGACSSSDSTEPSGTDSGGAGPVDSGHEPEGMSTRAEAAGRRLGRERCGRRRRRHGRRRGLVTRPICPREPCWPVSQSALGESAITGCSSLDVTCSSVLDGGALNADRRFATEMARTRRGRGPRARGSALDRRWVMAKRPRSSCARRLQRPGRQRAVRTTAHKRPMSNTKAHRSPRTRPASRSPNIGIGASAACGSQTPNDVSATDSGAFFDRPAGNKEHAARLGNGRCVRLGGNGTGRCGANRLGPTNAGRCGANRRLEQHRRCGANRRPAGDPSTAPTYARACPRYRQRGMQRPVPRWAPRRPPRMSGNSTHSAGGRSSRRSRRVHRERDTGVAGSARFQRRDFPRKHAD